MAIQWDKRPQLMTNNGFHAWFVGTALNGLFKSKAASISAVSERALCE
jgi:hypothetical protein